MQKFLSEVTGNVAGFMNIIAAIILSGMMLLGVMDVVLRYLQKPLPGMYEVISLAGALVIGLSLPKTSIDKAHIYVDSLVQLLPSVVRKFFLVVTRIVSILLFVGLAVGLWKKGMELQFAREVSLTVGLSLYPFAYTLAFCSLIEALVLYTVFFLELKTSREAAQ